MTADPPGQEMMASKRPPISHGRRLHLALKVLIWAGIVSFVAAGLLVLRLSFGPLSIAFLQPYLKDSLSVGGAAAEVEFDDVTLALRRPSFSGRRAAPGLEIRLTNLRLMTADSGAAVALPEGAMTLSLSALLRGEIAARTLELRGLNLAAEWRDGELFAALAQDQGGSAFGKILIRLLLPPEGDRSSALRRVRIRDATLTLREAESNETWKIAGLNFDLKRAAAGIELLGEGALSGPANAAVPLRLDGRYQQSDETSLLHLAFEGLNPSRIAGASVLLGRLRGIDVPATGTVSLTFNRDLALTLVSWDIGAGAGRLSIPERYLEPLAIERLAHKASFDPAKDTLAIESLEVRFAGATITADGVMWRENGKLGARMHGDIANISFATLPRYWPQDLSRGAHDWISRNIPSGVATRGQFSINIPPHEDGAALPDDALDFQFDFKDLLVHYLRPMPPIVGGAGHAHLSLHKLDIDVKGGVADGVAAAGSKIHLGGFQTKGGSAAHVEATLKGSAPAIMRLIDHKPLGYTSKYGINPAALAGSGAVALQLDFPLLKSVSLDDVKFKVKADVRDLQAREILKEVNLSSPLLKLAVDAKSLTGRGDIKLNDTPFALDWRENFKPGKGPSAHYVLTGAVEGEGWKVLSLPFEDVVKGPVMVRLELQGQGFKISRGQGAFDFWSAETGVKALGWNKEARKPGLARFAFNRTKADTMVIRDLVYEDQAMRASGTVKVVDNKGIEEIVIDSLKIGDTLLAATASRRDAGAYGIAVTASSFDAQPFLSRLFASDGAKPELPDFTLDVMAAKVKALHDTALQDVTVTARFADGQWGKSVGAGKIVGGGSVDFALNPPATAGDQAASLRRFTLRSDDAAKVVRGIGLFSDALGGTLDFSGTMTPPGPAQVINGDIRIHEFRVVRAPVLAKILAVGSLTGVSDLLRGEGIRFERMTTPFTFSNGIMEFKRARAWGPAIGITIDGKINTTAGEAALHGNVVPAYTANRILGKLPLVGTLIVGGRGEGLFAFTYQVTGDLDDPDVSVNPLSVLTPGFLRGIFEGAPKLEQENP